MGQTIGHYGAALLLRDEVRSLGYYAEVLTSRTESGVYVSHHDLAGLSTQALLSGQNKLAMIIVRDVKGAQTPFPAMPGVELLLFGGGEASERDMLAIQNGACLRRFRLEHRIPFVARGANGLA